MSSNAARLQAQEQSDTVQLSSAQAKVMQSIVAKAQMEAVAVAAQMAKAANSDWEPKADASAPGRSSGTPARSSATLARSSVALARPSGSNARRRVNWEPLWRCLAVAMAFELGWWTWVAVQLHHPQLASASAIGSGAARQAPVGAAGLPTRENHAPGVANVAAGRLDPAPRAGTPSAPARAGFLTDAADNLVSSAQDVAASPSAPPADSIKLRLATSLDTRLLERRERIPDPQ